MSESCDSSVFSSSQEKEVENKVINFNWIIMLYSMPSLTTMVYFGEKQNKHSRSMRNSHAEET